MPKDFSDELTEFRTKLAESFEAYEVHTRIGNIPSPSPVVWQGEQLPALPPGQVWGMRIYPGGRRIVRPCDPDALLAPDSAVKQLLAGQMVEVWLDDAVMTLTMWQQE